jgi:hypothetical protein
MIRSAAHGATVRSAGVARAASSVGLVALALSAGCGVFWGEPIELFPGSDGASPTRDAAVHDPDDLCIEAVEPLVDGVAITGARADALVALAEGEHTSTMFWGLDAKTRIKFTLADVSLTAIRSQVNPQRRVSYTPHQCKNHVRVEGNVTIATADGKLAESVERVRFMAYDGDELRAEFDIAGDDFSGTYEPSLRREHCFVRSVIRILIASDGSHGSLTDDLSASVCSGDAGLAGTDRFAGGHWGSRWQNY